MKKVTSSMMIILTLCCIPAFTLSPLLLADPGAGTTNPNCVQFAKKDFCTYSGCDLTIDTCATETAIPMDAPTIPKIPMW